MSLQHKFREIVTKGDEHALAPLFLYFTCVHIDRKEEEKHVNIFSSLLSQKEIGICCM